MKTNILMIFILVLFGSRIYGQDPVSMSDHHKVYSVQLNMGLNQIREKNLLPLAHKGMATELSFETEKVKNSLRRFQFILTYSRLKTGLEEMAKSGNIKLGFNYSHNFLIFQKNKFRYYLGPQTSFCYNYMLYPNWDDSHGYWADYWTIGPDNILSVSLRHESEWFTSLNFSLFGLFSRPEEIRPFKMDDSSFGGIMKALNSKIVPGFMDRNLEINFKTEYRFPVFVTKREAITFTMNVIRISGNDGQPVFQIMNMFGIKIML
jgi:hypothetical protein